MVDAGTWSRLDESARREFREIHRQFEEALRDNGVQDGFDLDAKWSVQLFDGLWSISNGTKILPGVTSPRRDVIEALYADGVQNLGR